MRPLLDNLRSLETAQGYAELRMFIRSSIELDRMSRETRGWPEVLEVRLANFRGLKAWDLTEMAAEQLAESAGGNPRWLALAAGARIEARIARHRELAAHRRSRPRGGQITAGQPR